MRDTTFTPSRILIYLAVSLIAAAYLVPLIVVVLNSLRTNQEIAQTSMIGWPKQWAWNNYLVAWSDFCVAQTCAGIRPYMLNSALITIPATIVSRAVAASTPNTRAAMAIARLLPPESVGVNGAPYEPPTGCCCW